MRLLITGAGRMGIRHAMGALQSDAVESLTMMDIAPAALENAQAQLSTSGREKELRFILPGDLSGSYDAVIMSSTASDRLGACRDVLSLSPRNLLIEKPLGQSLGDVTALTDALSSMKDLHVSVNLNMRMYPFVKTLKSDINSLPQFEGLKYINFTGGTLGIGANGIHYLDFIYFLLDADDAEVVAASIDDNMIPSGRGPAFGDFGGWACIHFRKGGVLVGKSLLLLSSSSTVFGGWEIIGSHGRIRLNEIEGERVDILRRADSEMPMNRYAADYLPPVTTKIESPFLGDLTREWLNGIAAGKQLLPSLDQSVRVHKLMFDWLSHSTKKFEKYPIT